MEIKKMVDLETLTQEEREALESGLKTEEDFLVEHEESLKAQEAERTEKFKKTEEIAQNQKIRAEKAEAEAKKLKELNEKGEPTPKNDSLSQKDLLAIVKADVAEEDIDEVVSYAKLKNISVAEALKANVVKTILAEKLEERKTAEATSTGNARRGSIKTSPSELLKNSQKGILPDNDEELEALIKARRGIK